MSDLTNKRIQDSYGQVVTINATGNDGFDSTLRHIQDGGGGDNSSLMLSTTQANVSGELLISGINFQDYSSTILVTGSATLLSLWNSV